MKGMTRREKEVTDQQAILHILDTAQVVHLGLAVDNEPYVVPMNYGYRLENGELTLYIHSSCKGKKWEMLRKNPNVFFEMECDLVPFAGDVACRYGMAYASLMGRGKAEFVEDVAEKQLALSAIMKAQTGKDFSFEPKMTTIVTIVKIKASEFTAKRRHLPENMR